MTPVLDLALNAADGALRTLFARPRASRACPTVPAQATELSKKMQGIFTQGAGVTWVDTTAGSGARGPLTINIEDSPLWPATNKIGKQTASASDFMWTLWSVGNDNSLDFTTATYWVGGTIPTYINDHKRSNLNPAPDSGSLGRSPRTAWAA